MTRKNCRTDCWPAQIIYLTPSAKPYRASPFNAIDRHHSRPTTADSMAEVLPPPMQSTSTISMLHPRPSSADAFQGSQQQYTHSQRLGQAPRSMYHGHNNTYRGTAAPIQPYAFQSTPHLRQDSRTNSAPTTSHGPVGSHRPTASVSTSSSDTSSQPSGKEDSVLGNRPLSLINLSSTLPDLSLSFEQPAKASPDRYRRPAQKRMDSNNTAARTPSQLGATPVSAAAEDGASQVPEPVQRQASVDDMAMPKTGQSELAKRYRRTSSPTHRRCRLDRVHHKAKRVMGRAQPRPLLRLGQCRSCRQKERAYHTSLRAYQLPNLSRPKRSLWSLQNLMPLLWLQSQRRKSMYLQEDHQTE